MGYLEARAVDKRMRLVTAIEADEETIAALCRRFDLSRKAQERSIDALCLRIGKLLDLFQPHECANFFANSGHART